MAAIEGRPHNTMVSGANEAKIRFVLKFFKRTAIEIGFDIKCPRNATTRHNFDKKVIRWNSSDDFIHIYFFSYFNGSILKTGSPATANLQSAIKSSL